MRTYTPPNNCGVNCAKTCIRSRLWRQQKPKTKP
ncbi:CitQ (plasmid) [Lactococcus lactis subsp. lactis bv. diacetylactis]|uniref:CitQ n=2 Tax=Lactococcus lactis TaxID=1358 RepID=Q53511_9LACT|nr:CitQ [Lactococcus lactis]AAL02010.1 putative translational regulator CitQ [Lactococcus lactis]ADX30759.1 CitQ [Lactococcus lactis subsp. lactis]ARR88240.1 CitQ [Lactococcus lactis subsp. lactis bv. diacetylactis]